MHATSPKSLAPVIHAFRKSCIHTPYMHVRQPAQVLPNNSKQSDRRSWLGSPQNNQILFSVRTETNQNSICFGCFSFFFAKPNKFFSVCFGVSVRYWNNRNKPKKSLKNKSLLRCPWTINVIFGSNRNKPKLNLFWLFFGFFRETKQIFFRFVSVFRTCIETTETNRTYGMGN